LAALGAFLHFALALYFLREKLPDGSNAQLLFIGLTSFLTFAILSGIFLNLRILIVGVVGSLVAMGTGLLRAKAAGKR
jgi:hypothetical protein